MIGVAMLSSCNGVVWAERRRIAPRSPARGARSREREREHEIKHTKAQSSVRCWRACMFQIKWPLNALRLCGSVWIGSGSVLRVERRRRAQCVAESRPAVLRENMGRGQGGIPSRQGEPSRKLLLLLYVSEAAASSKACHARQLARAIASCSTYNLSALCAPPSTALKAHSQLIASHIAQRHAFVR